MSTVPFTRSTGLPAAAGVTEAGACATEVGACEATWALAAPKANRTNAQNGSACFIFAILVAIPQSESKGRDWLSPRFYKRLERGRNRESAVRFVGFATVALAAELRGLVGARSGRGRVVRAAEEEHGLVNAFDRVASVLGLQNSQRTSQPEIEQPCGSEASKRSE